VCPNTSEGSNVEVDHDGTLIAKTGASGAGSGIVWHRYPSLQLARHRDDRPIRVLKSCGLLVVRAGIGWGQPEHNML
jgi:hypothetical protein